MFINFNNLFFQMLPKNGVYVFSPAHKKIFMGSYKSLCKRRGYMIKKHDFIEVDYTVIIKEGNIVFDTTSEKIAKKENIFSKNAKYKPVIICVGEHQVPEGLDESFIGKDNEEYQVTLHPEKAFGKKNPKLLHLMSQTSFRKQNIAPYPGLQMNID